MPSDNFSEGRRIRSSRLPNATRQKSKNNDDVSPLIGGLRVDEHNMLGFLDNIGGHDSVRMMDSINAITRIVSFTTQRHRRTENDTNDILNNINALRENGSALGYHLISGICSVFQNYISTLATNEPLNETVTSNYVDCLKFLVVNKIKGKGTNGELEIIESMMAARATD